jgi:hypothetical protein
MRDYSCQNIFFNLSKLYLISLIFFFSFILSTLAKAPPPITLDPPQPWRTERLKKEVKDQKTHYIINGEYKSQLSQKEIFDFYNAIFSAQGMQLNHTFEELKNNYLKTFTFKLGLIKSVTLNMFTSSVDERFTLYFLYIFETKDILFLSDRNFDSPQPPTLIPPYLNATQLSYDEEDKHSLQSFNCFIHADIKDVIEFYLKEMPKHKWNLASKKDRAGKYNLFAAFTMDHPKVPAVEEKLKIKLEDEVPGVDVDIEGSTLIFEKGKEKCIIIIIKFLDPPQTLKTMRIDPLPFEKYGRILLQATYYAE